MYAKFWLWAVISKFNSYLTDSAYLKWVQISPKTTKNRFMWAKFWMLTDHFEIIFKK